MKYVSPESSPSLSLPVIGLGTYHLLDRMTDDGAIRAIHGAHAAGVYFIDTSDNYMNERLIGRAVAESSEPGRIIVATKTGLATTYDEHLRFIAQKRSADLSPERIRHQIEVSLGTLGMSKVDIYQIHAYDYLTPASDVVQTMGDLHHKDMFSVWGVSNYSDSQLEELIITCDRLGVPRPTTVQPFYSMLSSFLGDSPVDFARDNGMLILAHSPLMKGLLVDKTIDLLKRTLEQSVPTRGDETRQHEALSHATEQLVRLSQYAHQNGYTLSEYALAWLINQPATIAVNACLKPEHLASSLKASEWQIPPEGLELVEEVRTDVVVKLVVGQLMTAVSKSKPYYAKRIS